MQKDNFSSFSAANVIKNPFLFRNMPLFLSMNFNLIHLIVKITALRDLHYLIISLKFHFPYLIVMFILKVYFILLH